MKIVFFGTPHFSVPTLKSLHFDNEIEVISVVTQQDKKSGRNGTLAAPPVKIAAENLNIPVIQPKNKNELLKNLKDISADFFVVIAFGMILPKEVLDIPKHGAINIHASLLPKYRGASPIQESLLHGDSQTGISIIKMDEKLDHGPIYVIKRINIEDDNLETLSKKLALLGSNLITETLKDIEKNLIIPIPQEEKNATYCKKIKKTDGKIDWNNKNASEIINMINAYTPWPSVYTTLKNKKIKILEAEIDKSEINTKPGKFLIENHILKISTIKDFLIPKKLQIEGKKEMDIKSFLNGYKNLIPN